MKIGVQADLAASCWWLRISAVVGVVGLFGNTSQINDKADDDVHQGAAGALVHQGSQRRPDLRSAARAPTILLATTQAERDKHLASIEKSSARA